MSNAFDNFLSTTSTELKKISRTMLSNKVVKKKKTIRKSVYEKLKKHVKSINGKLIVCIDSLVVIEIPKNNGSVESIIYKRV